MATAGAPCAPCPFMVPPCMIPKNPPIVGGGESCEKCCYPCQLPNCLPVGPNAMCPPAGSGSCPEPRQCGPLITLNCPTQCKPIQVPQMLFADAMKNLAPCDLKKPAKPQKDYHKGHRKGHHRDDHHHHHKYEDHHKDRKHRHDYKKLRDCCKKHFKHDKEMRDISSGSSCCSIGSCCSSRSSSEESRSGRRHRDAKHDKRHDAIKRDKKGGRCKDKPDYKREECKDPAMRGRKKQRDQYSARTRSRELRGGILYIGCDCEKKNGLQDDCRRSLCHGSPECKTIPPTCIPSQYSSGKHLMKIKEEMEKLLRGHCKL